MKTLSEKANIMAIALLNEARTLRDEARKEQSDAVGHIAVDLTPQSLSRLYDAVAKGE